MYELVVIKGVAVTVLVSPKRLRAGVLSALRLEALSC